ncbi:P22 phage major capsid protein family protein [Cohnella silvisoli]|uniref:P22 phage major capsid protein family protein n=1 Tax=Cohnella silvisoli TaxID=2873699 RepID=A0ABV1L3Y0_9BACL|nr:P22 phage major capsid protein family protein [Cohnella silvisoli]MCD9026041.1 P22 coat protein [Cohnella silvisoli]
MANTYLTVQDIARNALLRLRNNLVTLPLVHRDHSGEFKNKGDSVQVKRPNTFTAQEFNGATAPQDINESEVTVKLDKIADVSVDVTSKELTLNINDFSNQIVNPAMEAIAQKIDRDLLGLYLDIPYHVGTSGTTPTDLTAFASARRRLNVLQAPNSLRSAIWNPDADEKFSVIPAIVNAEKSGSTEALREGSIGRIQGLDNFMDQNIYTHAAGGYTALADAKATGALGATTIALASTAGASVASLKKGDLLDIGNYQYVVTEDTANAVAGAIAAVKIYPGLKVAAAAAAITFPDKTPGAHVANLAFHKNAFAFVNRPLALPQGGASGYVASFEGLSVRVTQGYSMGSKVNQMSFDILYGVKTLQQELAVQVLG